MPPSSSRAERGSPALTGLFAVALTAGLASLAAPACFGDACKRTDEIYDKGSLLDENTWQSTPLDRRWLPYPPARVYQFYYAEHFKARGLTPDWVQVYISADQTDRDSPDYRDVNFTIAGGDVAKIYNVTGESLFLQNGTCADYYVRVVVHGSRAPQTSPPPR